MIMKNIRNWIVSLAIVAAAGGALFVIATPQTALAADGGSCNAGFLGFPAWYRGLTNGDCSMKSPSDMSGGISTFIWTIALNIIDIALMLVGYLSVGFVIYGGFLMLTSRGKPNDIAEAQVMIRNAVIGLVISFGSVAVVNFIAAGLK